MSTRSAAQLPRLSEKSFLERAACELRELKGDVIDLVEDHDIYWKMQYVIQSNVRLLMDRSSFFDMVNDSFAHSAAIRVRRVVDTDHRTISLLKLLKELENYPGLLGGKTGEDGLRDDIQELEQATNGIKAYVDQFVAHRDRTPTADTPRNRELTRAIETIARMFKKYYGVVMKADIELRIGHLEDPLRIFRYPWMAA
jgi:hypothetical protein